MLGAAGFAEIIGAGVAMVDRARHNPPLTIQVPPPGLIAEAGTPPPALPAGAVEHPQVPGRLHSQPSFGDPFETITKSTPAAKASPPLLVAALAPLTSAKAPPLPAAVTPVPAPVATPTPAATAIRAAAATPAATPMPVASLPKPTPVPESQVTMPESRVDGLVAEARALRQRGDTSTAITRLREALAISPKNTVAITELAATYEKMGLQDKAMEQWRIIYDMGDSAGIYYELADAKLKAAEAGQATPAPRTTAVTADTNGFQPGASLALVNLSTVEKPETSDGYKRFTLKIPVKRKADTKIDVAGVVIQAFLYDQLGDGSVVRTNAKVSYRWAALPADWQQEDIEILEVDYTQAPPEPGKLEETRHYYGYVVCIYYNKELQDQAADPVTLLKKYPPPLTLQEKDQ